MVRADPGHRVDRAIVWRLLDEEAQLTRDLPGYVDYQRKVRARLVPSTW